MSSELLKSLGLDAINAGTYLGNGVVERDQR